MGYAELEEYDRLLATRAEGDTEKTSKAVEIERRYYENLYRREHAAAPQDIAQL